MTELKFKKSQLDDILSCAYQYERDDAVTVINYLVHDAKLLLDEVERLQESEKIWKATAGEKQRELERLRKTLEDIVQYHNSREFISYEEKVMATIAQVALEGKGMRGQNVYPVTAYSKDDVNRCANCGKPMEEAKEIIVGSSTYDGEWCCGSECIDQHDTLGCPFEHGILYRDMKY